MTHAHWFLRLKHSPDLDKTLLEFKEEGVDLQDWKCFPIYEILDTTDQEGVQFKAAHPEAVFLNPQQSAQFTILRSSSVG
jgi:hypothetical protein